MMEMWRTHSCVPCSHSCEHKLVIPKLFFCHHDATIIMIRTTIILPDDILRVARSLAHQKGVSLGDALAELARAGLRPPGSINRKKPFPTFNQKPNAKPLTLEQTLDAEDEI